MTPVSDGRAPLPLLVHVAGLLAVLLLLLPLVGTRGLFSSDEGATLHAAQRSSRGEPWIVEPVLVRGDGRPAHYAYATYEEGTKGRAPYAKHPLHVIALGVVLRVGGVGAVLVASCVGAALAAWAAGRLADVVRPGTGVLAVWVAGLATPLLFDSYLVMGHAIGAAAMGWAAVTGLAAVRGSWPAAVAAGTCAAAGALVRTEAVLMALGLAAALVAAGAIRRSWVAALGGAAVVATVAGAVALERAWVRRLVGAPLLDAEPARGAVGSEGFVADRVAGFTHSVLSLPSGREAVVFALVVAVAVAAGAHVRRSSATGPLLVLAAAATAVAVMRVALGGAPIVHGLIPATPALVAAAVVLRRRDVAGDAGVLAGALLTGWALVAATQYRIGGGSEWGGRYFAAGLPLAVGLLVPAAHRITRGLDRTAATAFAAVLGIAALTLSASAVATLRATHRGSASIVGAAEAAAVDAGDGGSPVMVATRAVVPRFAWRNFDQHRWLLVDEDDLAEANAQLRAASVRRYVVVRPLALGPPPAATVHLAPVRPPEGWAVYVVERP